MSKKKEQKPLKWTFPEYASYSRGTGWYLLALIISGAIIVHSLLTANWLFALIIIMIGIILVINQRNKPKRIEFEINHSGIKLAGKTYKYDQINKFWIIYQPPQVKNLYFDFKSPFKPNLPVSLEKENPLQVKSFLRQYLEEDLEQEQEPLSDVLGRLLKM